VKDVEVIKGELQSFGAHLEDKPVIMAASKIDIVNKEKLVKLKRYCKREGLELFPISAVTGKGIDDLMYAMAERVEEVRMKASGDGLRDGMRTELDISSSAEVVPVAQRKAK
jgi:GTP-binding protein